MAVSLFALNDLHPVPLAETLSPLFLCKKVFNTFLAIQTLPLYIHAKYYIAIGEKNVPIEKC